MNSESTIIKAPKAEALLNVNTQEEFDRAQKLSEEKSKPATVIHGINS
jgi:GTP:adenosylcobinamide-phosphate guanylyltransferase